MRYLLSTWVGFRLQNENIMVPGPFYLLLKIVEPCEVVYVGIEYISRDPFSQIEATRGSKLGNIVQRVKCDPSLKHAVESVTKKN